MQYFFSYLECNHLKVNSMLKKQQIFKKHKTIKKTKWYCLKKIWKNNKANSIIIKWKFHSVNKFNAQNRDKNQTNIKYKLIYHKDKIKILVIYLVHKIKYWIKQRFNLIMKNSIFLNNRKHIINKVHKLSII